jgi:hypothetical protein
VKQRAIRKVDDAIRSGQLWRAKEILSSNIATEPFDPILYHRYGDLLLKMGDDIEAGKYLFLSGVREKQYEQVINLFVRRHTKKDHPNLFDTFPAHARLGSLQGYPEATAKDLQGLGFPSTWEKKRPEARRPTRGSKLKAYLGLGLIGFLLLCLLVGIITGIVKVISIIGAIRSP